MIEKAYLFRRMLHMIAFALGALILLFGWCYSLCAHVDLVHVEIDTIVQEIMQDIRNDQERAIRELAGQDYGNREEGNEPGVKHD